MHCEPRDRKLETVLADIITGGFRGGVFHQFAGGFHRDHFGGERFRRGFWFYGFYGGYPYDYGCDPYGYGYDECSYYGAFPLR